MPVSLRPGSLKSPEVAALFDTGDPDKRFTDLREIGHGSFGAVYFAYDTSDNCCVAVKKMAFSGKQASEKWRDIIKELQFMRALDNPHVVIYRGCFLKEQICWLVMEYCVGSAADIIEVHKKALKETEISALCHQVLKGLLYLHNMGRIHRDIKAGNILLTDRGVVKLGDFGSASFICPAQSFVGTPYWMAPEVIMAMDEGQYDTKADIWSLGITCIELSDRKPPLFNMNAMSALYHIAQNDSPTLASDITDDGIPWSQTYRDFIAVCLSKDPDLRPNTEETLEHPFVHNSSDNGLILLELVERTKEVVRDLDNFQYKRMRKLMYLDDQHSNAPSSAGADGGSVGSADLDDDLSIADSPYNSIHSGNSFPSRGQHPLRSGLPPPLPPHQEQNSDNVDNKTIIVVDENRDQIAPSPPERVTSTADGNINEIISFGVQGRDAKEELATLRRSKFSTLRTARRIVMEHEEHAHDNNMYEQMDGYKRLRQVNQRELKQLEEKFRAEKDVLKVKLDKEYDLLMQQFNKELEKLKTSLQNEQLKMSHTNEELLKKLRKRITTQQENEMKTFQTQRKKEYKQKKDQIKMDLKTRYEIAGAKRNSWEPHLKEKKCAIKSHMSKREGMLLNEQKNHLETETRKLRRNCLVEYHCLKRELLIKELDCRNRHLRIAHDLLRKHTEQKQQMDVDHLCSLQHTRQQHLTKQHQFEMENQENYTQQQRESLRKKHALQAKQQPRELKAKEILIRKQYHQAVKTQTKQFKALQSQLLHQLPKEEHREMIACLKQEQKRKIALLGDQYELTIGQMVENQTVKLESWQEEEALQLHTKLQTEIEMLKAYQDKQKKSMEKCADEETLKCKERLSLQRKLIDEKIAEECRQLTDERNRRLDDLMTSQRKDLEEFDQETARLGITLLSTMHHDSRQTLSSESSSTSTTASPSNTCGSPPTPPRHRNLDLEQQPSPPSSRGTIQTQS